jgi:hypothetical protein
MKKGYPCSTVFLIILILCMGNLSVAQQNTSAGNTLTAAERECIKEVTRLDDSLGVIRNHACEKISLSMSIKNYAGGLRKLNFKNCPAGFSKAFDTHTKAWMGMLKVTDRYPGLRGEMHSLFDQLEKSADSVEFKKHLKMIWDTWAGIEKYIKSP